MTKPNKKGKGNRSFLLICGLASLTATSLLALIVCPHSKVEESFGLQATHDLYYINLFGPYATSSAATSEDDNEGSSLLTQEFDHIQFPGVVPRSFTGPWLLAFTCRFVGKLLQLLVRVQLNAMQVQFLARLTLLLLNLYGFYRLANSVSKNDDPWKGFYLLVITACQFHLPFYMSRMLPNTFALCLVLHSYADWFSNRISTAAVGLVAATTIFRCDVLLLLFAVGLGWLVRRDLAFFQAIRIGVVTGLACLIVIVPLDSIFWKQSWMWAEGQVFYYNAILGKSENWGVSPWHWYATSALPRALLATALLIPLAFLRVPEWLVAVVAKRTLPSLSDCLDFSYARFFLPIIVFIGLYSCLGHKELRFLFPALPMLNVVAAVGLTRLHRVFFLTSDKKMTTMKQRLLGFVMYLSGLGLLVVTLAASLTFLSVSSRNYPGGEALRELTAFLKGQAPMTEPLVVFVDVASTMSGVSRFGQSHLQDTVPMRVSFLKAGYEMENKAMVDNSVDFILSEDEVFRGFDSIKVINGLPRIDWRNVRIVSQPAIYIHQRQSNP